MKTVKARETKKEIMINVEGVGDFHVVFNPSYPIGYEKITEAKALDLINAKAFYDVVVKGGVEGAEYEDAVKVWLEGKVQALERMIEGIRVALGPQAEDLETILPCIDHESIMAIGMAIADCYVEEAKNSIERAFKV